MPSLPTVFQKVHGVMPSITSGGVKRQSMGQSGSKGDCKEQQTPVSRTVRKRKIAKLEFESIFEKHGADENMVQSAGEEEDVDEIKESVRDEGVKPENSVDNDDAVSEKTMKGNYYVGSGRDACTERFNTDFYHQMMNGDDLDSDLPDDAMNSVVYMHDKWKQEYSDGVQLLMKPHDLPRFTTESRTDNTSVVVRQRNFKPPKGLIVTDLTAPCTSGDHPQAQLPIPRYRFYLGDVADIAFLKKLNIQRRTNSRKLIAEETMLDIINILEIECYKKIHEVLLQSIHSPVAHEVDDNAPCSVCTHREQEPGDNMVFCDGCNICVHGSCYGLPENLPRGDWLCDMCSSLSTSKSVSCVFCPAPGGAMKLTVDGTWAHLQCALYIPECAFDNAEKRELIKNIDDIPAERWTLKCTVCDTRQGACMQCGEDGCTVAFHPTCASRSGYYFGMEEIEVNDDKKDKKKVVEDRVDLFAFCAKHSKPFVNKSSSDEVIDQDFRLRQLQKHFFLYADYESVSKRMKVDTDIVSDVYEYWKMKRSKNDGKSLIRNLGDNVKVQNNVPTLEVLPPLALNPKSSLLPDEETLAGYTYGKRKLLKQQYVRKALDKERQLLTMVLRREKLKQQLAEVTLKSLDLLVNGLDKGTVSHRAVDTFADVFATNYMTPEMVNRAEEELKAEGAESQPAALLSPLTITPVVPKRDATAIASPTPSPKSRMKKKGERRASDIHIKKIRRTESPDDQKENGKKPQTPSPRLKKTNRSQLNKLRSHDKALSRKSLA